MADSKPKFEPKLITGKGARLAFFRPDPQPRLGKDGKPKGKPKSSGTVLLDPTNKEHAATIALVVSETVRALNHRFATAQNPTPFNTQLVEQVARGEKSFPNFYLCWGYGNDLPKFGKKLYDGFKDMFYLKLTDENAPNLLTGQTDDKGKPIVAVPGDKRYPYSGCSVAFTTTIYSYDNESRGANANFRTLVFQGDGQAFGGGKPNAETEFAALGDIGDVGGSAPLADPFGGSGGAASDPFAIS